MLNSGVASRMMPAFDARIWRAAWEGDGCER